MAADGSLLTVDEAAAYLNLKPRTLRLWAGQGRVPVIRFGTGRRSRLRFRRSALERFIAAHQEPRRRAS